MMMKPIIGMKKTKHGICIRTNGYIIFEDGTKIESVKDRLLTFNGSEIHASSTCTDEARRISLAVNYF